jgi:hypothetical protein
MSAPMQADLQSRINAAREALDAWTREVVQWHFSPETGTPFWLERAKELDFDPLKDVNGYADLDKFGFFQDEWPGAPLGAERAGGQTDLHL